MREVLLRKKSTTFWVSLLTVTTLTVVCVFACGQKRQGPVEQVRPRRASVGPAVVELKSGGNLQAAIDAAQYGDTIVLQAGGTFNGPIMLPYKESRSASDDSYITIRTSNLAGIPAEGTRVKPELHAQAMPKIVAPEGQVAVGTKERAHHFKFIGVEFGLKTDSKYIYSLINLGESEYKSLPQIPHHLTFDRCYVHAPGLNRARRGFALNSAETYITNSHVSGFAGEGDETQAIAGWNGPGPFYIINNYLEGGGQNIMFGGADPAVPNLVPSDIEIRRNYLFKPAQWFPKATIKAGIELKNARRVVIDGNVLESEGSVGAFVLTVRNQGGKAPWSILEDINITNNIVRHTNTGFSILGRDGYQQSQQARNFRIANNLILDVGPDYSAAFIKMCCVDGVTVEHNTVQQTGQIILAYGQPSAGFKFIGNIVQNNQYGVYCERGKLADCFPSTVFTKNVIADNANVRATGYPIEPNFPIGNYFVPSYANIGFVDYLSNQWLLAPTSRFKGKALNGKDPGVDMAALDAAVASSDRTIALRSPKQ